MTRWCNKTLVKPIIISHYLTIVTIPICFNTLSLYITMYNKKSIMYNKRSIMYPTFRLVKGFVLHSTSMF